MLSSITFLEPAYLGALSFLGVVLLIHLLKKPRTVRLSFSTLRFFDESAVAATRSRRLRRLLLLAARLAIVALLVLLFARPVFKNDPLRLLGDTHNDLYIWIDRTLSMEYREEGTGMRGEAAVEIVDSIVSLRNGTASFVYDHDIEEFVPCDTAVPFSVRHGAKFDALGRACKRAFNDSRQTPLFIAVSDFQKPSADALDALRSDTQFSKVPFFALTLTPKKPWNAAITRVKTPRLRPDESVNVRITTQGLQDIPAKIALNIDNLRTPPTACTLSAGTDTTLDLTPPRRTKSGWGTVRLVADDPMQFDNTAHFVQGTTNASAVLIIGPEKINSPVASALKAADSRRWDPVTLIDQEKVTVDMCNGADLVIINGCRNAAALMRIIAATRGPRHQAFIASISNADESGDAASRISNEYLPIFGTVRSLATPIHPVLPDTVSELWRGFPSLHNPQISITSFFDALPGMAMAYLSNGKPLASRTTDPAERTWILISIPFGITMQNNLCESGFFVPFIDRCCSYALAARHESQSAWIAGTETKNPWFGSKLPAKIFDIDGKLILQLQQQSRFIIDQPGIYRVAPPGTEPFLKSVIADTIESRPDYRKPGESGKKSGWITVSPATILSRLERRIRFAEWIVPWIVLAVLFFIETLLRERTPRKNIR